MMTMATFISWATDLPNLIPDHPFVRTRWLGNYIDCHLDFLLDKLKHLLRHYDSEDLSRTVSIPILAQLRVHGENMPSTLVLA